MQGVSVLHHFDLSACTYQSKRRRLDMYSCALDMRQRYERGEISNSQLGMNHDCSVDLGIARTKSNVEMVVFDEDSIRILSDERL